jgi:hypothetical protein
MHLNGSSTQWISNTWRCTIVNDKQNNNILKKDLFRQTRYTPHKGLQPFKLQGTKSSTIINK